MAFEHRIIRSRRKTTAIYIRDGLAEVRTGLRTPQRYINALLAEKADWIEQAITREAVRNTERPTVKDGATLPFMGKPYRLSIKPGTHASITLTDNTLILTQGQSQNPADILSNWLKQRAVDYMTPLTRQLANQLGMAEKNQQNWFPENQNEMGALLQPGSHSIQLVDYDGTRTGDPLFNLP